MTCLINVIKTKPFPYLLLLTNNIMILGKKMFSLVEMFLMLLLPVLCLIGCSVVVSLIEEPMQSSENENFLKI